MRKYVTINSFTGSESLLLSLQFQSNKHLFKEIFIALLEKNRDSLNFNGKYTSNSPGYWVELIDPQKVEPYTFDDIKTVHYANYNGIREVLSLTWKQSESLREAIKEMPATVLSLNDTSLNSLYLLSDIENQTLNLLKLVENAKGKESYADLANIIIETNFYLKRSRSTKDYKELAKKYQGGPSPILQAIGICMLGFAALAVLAALTFPLSGAIVGTSLAVAGIGIFAKGVQQTGLCKQMHQIVSEFKAHHRAVRTRDLTKHALPRIKLWEEKIQKEREEYEKEGQPLLKGTEPGETLLLGRIYPIMQP